MKIIWRTDAHLAVKGPRSRKDVWVDTVLGKIDQVGQIALQEKADAVLDGGDFFHHTEPMKTSHALVSRVVEAHKRYPCPVYVCVGNHDYRYLRMDRLGHQPLGVLFETGVFNRLYAEHEAIFNDSQVKLRIVGVEYHGPTYDIERLKIQKKDEDVLIVVAHLYASATSVSMFGKEDIVPYSVLRDTEVDAYCFGHWHKDQGIHKIGNSLVVNTGSLTRGSLVEDEIQRKPCCVVMDVSSEGVRADRRYLDVQPAEDVFDLESREAERENAVAMQAFMEALNTSVKGTQQKDIQEVVLEIEDLPQIVKRRALDYLDKVGA